MTHVEYVEQQIPQILADTYSIFGALDGLVLTADDPGRSYRWAARVDGHPISGYAAFNRGESPAIVITETDWLLGVRQ